jgi:hypothetical protein
VRSRSSLILTAVIVSLLACGLTLSITGREGKASADVRATVAFRPADPRLTEASGLAVGIRSPAARYLQNDSGDGPRFFALDGRTGHTLAVVDVPDARNVDWEDIAVARDPAGTPSVWLADVGDNDASRAEVQVYRTDEPALRTGGPAELTATTPDVWRLRYPDGPHNAESMIVDPVTSRIYLITKSLDGRSGVYLAPPGPDRSRVQVLTRVGSVRFGFTGTAGGPNVLGQITATGANMSSDGRVLVVRTYTDAYLWPVTGNDIPDALTQPPVRTALPDQPFGEGIALLDGEILIDSEGATSPVFLLPLPASVRSPSPSRATPSSATPSEPTGVPATSADRPGAQLTADHRTASDTALVIGAAAVGGLLVLALVRGAVRRRRRRSAR